MSEWLAVEAIVRQREKEKNAKAMAKISAEKRVGTADITDEVAAEKHVCRQHEMDGDDVFEDISDISDPGMDYDEDNVIYIQEEKDSGNCEDEEELNESEVECKERQNEEAMEKDVKTAAEPKENEACIEVKEDISFTTEINEHYSKAENENQQLLMALPNDDETISKADEAEEIPELEVTRDDLMETVALEFDEIGQDKCLSESDAEVGLTPEQGTGGALLLSLGSPSTSSYETVGNEFTDMMEIGINENEAEIQESKVSEENKESDNEGECIEEEEDEQESSRKYHSVDDVRQGSKTSDELAKPMHAVIITQAASNDALELTEDQPTDETSRKTSLMSPMNEDITVVASLDALQEPKSACVSPASSNGGVYSVSDFAFKFHVIYYIIGLLSKY